MHDAAIAGPVNDARDVDIAGKVGRNHEAAIHVFARRRYREVGARVEGEVGRAEAPAVDKLAWRRKIGGVALGCIGIGPLGDRRDLGARKRSVTSQSQSEVRHSLPRRHDAIGDDARNVRGSLAGLLVGLEAKRRDLALTMAVKAMFLQERRDVFAVVRSGVCRFPTIRGPGRWKLPQGYGRGEPMGMSRGTNKARAQSRVSVAFGSSESRPISDSAVQGTYCRCGWRWDSARRFLL